MQGWHHDPDETTVSTGEGFTCVIAKSEAKSSWGATLGLASDGDAAGGGGEITCFGAGLYDQHKPPKVRRVNRVVARAV